MSETALVERQGTQSLAAPTETAALLSVIERAATNPEVDIDKMERLLAMQERVFARNAEMEFNAAMTRAQGKMRRISADANNPQTRSKYASYAALDRALRPVYTDEGFALSFGTAEGAPELYVRVCCHVSHQAGHSRDYHVDMPADGKGAKGGDVMTKTHAVGAGMSYGMRYLLKMIFNVAVGEDDNDGNEPVERVSAEQVANLQALIDEVGADKRLFLRYMKAGKLEDIQACAYKDAVRALEKKRANNGPANP